MSSHSRLQRDNMTRRKAQIISNRFVEHHNEFSVLKKAPQSPDLNAIEHLWDLVQWEILITEVQQTNGPKYLEKYFQHLAESMP